MMMVNRERCVARSNYDRHRLFSDRHFEVVTGERLVELCLSEYFAKTVRQLSWADVLDG